MAFQMMAWEWPGVSLVTRHPWVEAITPFSERAKIMAISSTPPKGFFWLGLLMKKIPTLTPPTILHRCSFQHGCDLMQHQQVHCKMFFPSRKDNCRAENYIHGRNPPALTLMDDEPLVSLAEPGSYYQMEYIVGGGGGHFIIARDWVRGPCFWANDWRRFWEVEIWGAMVFGAVPSLPENCTTWTATKNWLGDVLAPFEGVHWRNRKVTIHSVYFRNYPDSSWEWLAGVQDLLCELLLHHT